MAKNTTPQPTQKLHPAWEAGKKPMSEFTKDELTEIEDRIRTATMTMLLRHEFFGIVALKLKREITDKVPSAAVDGRTIFYNPGFVQALTPQEIIFLVAHEVYHVVFTHFLRRQSRDPKLWNYAGDFVINYLLRRDSIGKTIEGALIDDKFKDMTSEQVYDQMMKDADKWKSSGLQTLDVHFDVGDGDSDGDGYTISEEDAKAIADEVRDTIIQSAKSCGNTPGEISRMVDELLTPRIDWKDLVTAVTSSKIPYDTTFVRPDRRSWSNAGGFIFPGDVPENNIPPKMYIALDASGSYTTEMLKTALSETYGLMQSYAEFKVHVFTFDTKVYNPVEFDETMSDEIAAYEPKGGGGTSFVPFFKHVEKQINNSEDENPLLIVFTDMYASDLDTVKSKYNNLCDTVWIVDGNKSPDIPFGKHALYSYD